MACYYNSQPPFAVKGKPMDQCFITQTTMPSDEQSTGLPYTHFALMYIDADGEAHLQASESIANTCQEILSTKVMGAFLRAVDMSTEACPSNYRGMPVPPNQATAGIAGISHTSPAIRPPYVRTGLGNEGETQRPTPAATPFQPLEWPIHSPFWPCLPTEGPSYNWKEFRNEGFHMMRHKKVMISVEDRDLLASYYTKAFENLQQTNCRVLAKAYIKLVEPRKQVNYPYNGRRIIAGVPKQLDPKMTKPPWWPEGVSHREPDHLPKVERIRLLVHILCELRTSHGVSVAKLREADRPIRYQIFPPQRLQVLEELYQVRQQEENFLEGTTGGQNVAWISRANLPETADKYPSPIDGSGNSNPSNPATVRDSETFIDCGRYASTANAPRGNFPVNSSLSYHARPSQIAVSEPGGQILERQPSFGSVMSVSPHALKRKHESIGSYPVNPRSPTGLTNDSPPTSRGSQPFSIKGDYGTPYQFQSPELLVTGPSIPGLIKERMESYGTFYYSDTCA